MAVNRAFREREDLAEEIIQAAAARIPVAEDALAPLIDEGALLVHAAIEDALVAAGFTDGIRIQSAQEPAESVAIGISMGDGACLYGSIRVTEGVRPIGVELDAGGYIADGGCLAAR